MIRLVTGFFQDFNSLKRRQGVGDIRKVVLIKETDEGLGMSITVSTANTTPHTFTCIRPGGMVE